jgi:hypothetical protein
MDKATDESDKEATGDTTHAGITQALMEGKKVVLAGTDGLGDAMIEVDSTGGEEVVTVTVGRGVMIEATVPGNYQVAEEKWASGLTFRVGPLEIQVSRAASDDGGEGGES